MANRKKLTDQKYSVPIQIRVTPKLKADLDALAERTGISTSERARLCLEQAVGTSTAEPKS